VLAVGVRVAVGPSSGRACGTLADIWVLGMTCRELFRAISCHSFWWDAARGETRESILAPSTPGRLGCLAAKRLMELAGFVPVSSLSLPIFINI